MKNIALVLLMIAALMSVGNCRRGGGTLTVADSDRACKKDTDCMLAMVRCSCHCGAPINKKHWNKYLDRQKKMCRNYKGKMCKMRCDQKVGCVKERCEILKNR